MNIDMSNDVIDGAQNLSMSIQTAENVDVDSAEDISKRSEEQLPKEKTTEPPAQ